jgi:hypothetical protein
LNKQISELQKEIIRLETRIVEMKDKESQPKKTTKKEKSNVTE